MNIDPVRILILDDDSLDDTGKIAEKSLKAQPGEVEMIHQFGLQLGLDAAYTAWF